MFRFRLALRQKKVPASLTWWHFSEVLLFFALWFSADSSWQSNAKAKLRQVRSVTNSKKNVKEHMHVPVQKIVLTQSYDAKLLPAASHLDAGAPGQRQRSVRRYLYISWQKAKSTHNCGARLRLAPIKFRTFRQKYEIQYVSVIAWVYDFRKFITMTDVSLQAICIACTPIASFCSQHGHTHESSKDIQNIEFHRV